MSPDDPIDRAAEDLRRHQAASAPVDHAWQRFTTRADAPGPTVRPTPPARPPRRFFVAGLAVGLAAATVVAVVVVTSDEEALAPAETDVTSTSASPATTTTVADQPTTTVTTEAPITTTSAPPATTTTPVTSPPDIEGPLFTTPPEGSTLIDASVVPNQRGWAIVRTADSSTRLVVIAPESDWSDVALPADAANPTIVRFADAGNGWVAAPTGLWSTHDGGSTWTRVASLGAEIHAIEVAGVVVHVVAWSDGDTAFRIFTSPVASDDFTASPAVIRPGGGPVAEFDMAVVDGGGWLVYNDRVVSGGARLVDGQWVDWTPPCVNEAGAVSVGDPFLGPVQIEATSPSVVFALCSNADVSGVPTNPNVSVSTDFGETFTPLGALPDATQAFGPAMLLPGPSVVYRRDDGVMVVATSADEGATWQVATTLDANATLLPAFQTGAMFGSRTYQAPYSSVPMSGALGIVSDDDGRSWSALPGG